MENSLLFIVLQAVVIASLIVSIPYLIGWCSTGDRLIGEKSKVHYSRNYSSDTEVKIKAALLEFLRDRRYSLTCSESELFILKKEPSILHYGLFFLISIQPENNELEVNIDVFSAIGILLFSRFSTESDIRATINRLYLNIEK